MASRKKLSQKHPFYIKVKQVKGGVKTIPFRASVFVPAREVMLTLRPEHVLKSMKLHGRGSTTTCSVAVCALDHEGAFPHPTTGYIDFFYSRTYVSSKDSAIGMPSECYGYEHDCKEIAVLNDKGPQALLAMVQKMGSIDLVLRPIQKQKWQGRAKTRGIKTGAISRRRKLRGHELRAETAMQGSNAGAPFI